MADSSKIQEIPKRGRRSESSIRFVKGKLSRIDRGRRGKWGNFLRASDGVMGDTDHSLYKGWGKNSKSWEG